MRPGRGERIQTVLSAPMQVGAQVRLGVNSRLALEPGQIGGCGQPDRIEAWRGQNLSKAHGCHRPTIRPSFRAVEDRRSGADRSELAESRMFARPHTYVPTSASIRHLRASDGYSTEEVWRARSPNTSRAVRCGRLAQGEQSVRRIVAQPRWPRACRRSPSGPVWVIRRGRLVRCRRGRLAVRRSVVRSSVLGRWRGPARGSRRRTGGRRGRGRAAGSRPSS